MLKHGVSISDFNKRRFDLSVRAHTHTHTHTHQQKLTIIHACPSDLEISNLGSYKLVIVVLAINMMSAEENIWAYEGRGNRGVEETA